MKISTISFEIQGEKMALPPDERIKYILDAVKKEKPDILLGSGYCLDTIKDLEDLVCKLKINKNTTNLIVEVKIDNTVEHPLRNVKPDIGSHCLYLINRKNEVQKLGPQIFKQSMDVKGKSKPIYTEAFHKILKKRTFRINSSQVVVLCCGEINVITGRDNINFISKESKELLQSCDIVLNPTHDCMANYGTLKAKRKFLSKLNKGYSIYVNSSNWNTNKKSKSGSIRKQSQDNSFIQNVYQNGKKLEMVTNIKTEKCLLNSTITKK